MSEPQSALDNYLLTVQMWDSMTEELLICLLTDMRALHLAPGHPVSVTVEAMSEATYQERTDLHRPALTNADQLRTAAQHVAWHYSLRFTFQGHTNAVQLEPGDFVKVLIEAFARAIGSNFIALERAFPEYGMCMRAVLEGRTQDVVDLSQFTATADPVGSPAGETGSAV